MLTEYIVVDLEMTGLKPGRDRILEIGAVHMKQGQVIETYQTLVNPMLTISDTVVELTGITQEMAETGKSTEEAVAGFLAFAGNLPLVGHNIAFDYAFLKHGAVNHDMTLEAEVLDTLKLARKLLPQLEKKTLEFLCEYFHISREEEHRALADATATAELLELLKEQYIETQPELFEPKLMEYKVKKQGPITPRQKKYLKELVNYHKIDISVNIEGLTRNEASRLTDKLLSQYGRMPK